MNLMSKIITFLMFLATLAAVFLLSDRVSAAEPEVIVKDASYSAQFISQSESDPVTIIAGGEKTIKIKFKNTGTVSWSGSSNKYISAYTMEPRERSSVFRGSDWTSAKQSGKISGTVKPGEVGELVINLRAPDKAGEYLEKFYLAAENYSWVKGGYFYLKIKVEPKTAVVVSQPTVINSAYKVNRFGLIPKEVKVAGGEKVLVAVLLQNNGAKTWPNFSITDSSVGSGVKSTFYDETWVSNNAVFIKNDPVPPDESMRVEFFMRAPAKKGNYIAQLALLVDSQVVAGEGAKISIPFEVLSDDLDAETESLPETAVFVPRLSGEPKIRVGVWKPSGVAQFVSFEDDYKIFDGDKEIGVLGKKYIAILNYADGVYSFNGGGIIFTTNNFIRLEPMTSWRSVFSLYNYEHFVSWKGPSNFNKYRGALEYRLSEKGTIYAINEVLFEDYIAGIAETSAGAPLEFIKANLVAARSYAYYVKEHTDKHASRYFDVVSTTGDQLYLGVVSEELMPRVVQAAQETRGMMATYGGNIVLTPYFGNSNGWTKSYVSVWGGSSKPWLVPVKANYDAGRTRLGHGVGMSQRDCALRAEKEGLDYISLIKFYYTGVVVEKIFI